MLPSSIYAGDASNAGQTIGYKKKKRRSREQQPDSYADTGRKKRKKRKPDDGLDNGDAERTQPDTGSRKSKKNKDKEVVVQRQDSDSDIDANAQASTTALLNAIVAAVSKTTPPEDTPPPQTFVLPPQPPFIGFPLPFGQFPQVLNHPEAAFPNPAIADLAYGSNDDILRALHNIDVSKIAGVMKTLGDAADAAHVSAFAPPPSFVPPPLGGPPPVGQLPVGSSTIMKVPRTARHVAPQMAGTDSNNDHAHILATKWFSARQLQELVDSEGLVYKKGKFSATEHRQILSAIEAHKERKNLTDDDLVDIIFPKNEKTKNSDFWSEVAGAVAQRPLIAIYHHVRRTHHPLKQQGSWSIEEDGKLKQAVTDLGQQWEKVSVRVGRMAADCRDRYRNHIQGREIRVSGVWSKEEEDELTRIVTDMTIKQGRDIDNDVFWSRVSMLMGGRRGRQQCRIKWTDSLSKSVKNEGMKPRWSHQDAYILVHKVDSLNVNDDTEIDWKTLPDPDWNLWSAHTMQRRWLTMKRSIKGYEEMSHQEIVDILRVKKSYLPIITTPPPGSKKKGRKITSATTILDEAVVNGGNPEASSSTGLGTLVQEDSEDSK